MKREPERTDYAEYFEDSNFSPYLGDCLEVMPDIAAGPVDMVFADPPYFLVSRLLRSPSDVKLLIVLRKYCIFCSAKCIYFNMCPCISGARYHDISIGSRGHSGRI